MNTTLKLPWQRGDYKGAKATAARVQRFVQVTGLKPFKERWLVFGEYGEVRPDGADHTKVKDPRYRWFADRYGARCWELDALSPVVLRKARRGAHS